MFLKCLKASLKDTPPFDTPTLKFLAFDCAGLFASDSLNAFAKAAELIKVDFFGNPLPCGELPLAF